MEIVLAAALVLTVVGFLVALERKDKRADTERQLLLQRIQAPEVAVAQAIEWPEAPEPEPVDPDTQAWYA